MTNRTIIDSVLWRVQTIQPDADEESIRLLDNIVDYAND
eukprot:UN05988